MSEPFLPNSFSLILSQSPISPIMSPSSGEDISPLVTPDRFLGYPILSPSHFTCSKARPRAKI
jgi:hypothetical protein